tara:strand:+ start:114 stop:413 length:300 start_codon:yes stop_codon:yes gene_type:complete
MIFQQLFSQKRTIHFIKLQIFLILLFTILYYIVAKIGKKNSHFIDNVPPFDLRDGLYLSLVTHSTVGYGDIAPRSNLARMVASIQMITIIFSYALYFVS